MADFQANLRLSYPAVLLRQHTNFVLLAALSPPPPLDLQIHSILPPALLCQASTALIRVEQFAAYAGVLLLLNVAFSCFFHCKSSLV